MHITGLARRAGALAIGAMLAPVWSPTATATATAVTGGLPDDVVRWFASDAAAVVARTQAHAVTADRRPVMGFVEVQVGAPTVLTTWAPDYVAGLEGAAPVAPVDEWIAPMTDDGRAVGTVTATRTAQGVVELAFFDDNVSVARGLLSLPDGASVVYDPPLDAYFTVTGDVVAPMSDTSRTELAAPTSVAQFQRRVVARATDGGADVSGLPATDPRRAMAGGSAVTSRGRAHESGPGVAGWLVAGTLAATGGTALVIRRRRAGSRT